MPHNIYHLDPNSALGKAMTEENIELLKQNQPPMNEQEIITTNIGTNTPELIQEAVEKTPRELYSDIEDVYTPRPNFKVDSSDLEFPLDLSQNGMIDANTMIVSDANDKINWEKDLLFITAGRRVVNNVVAQQLLNFEFKTIETEDDKKPTVAPSFDQWEIRGIDHNTKTERDQAEKHKYTIQANRHLIVVANAFNYIDTQTGRKNRDGIVYTWKFTSGDTNYDISAIDKVVGNGRQLSIPDIQREDIGTYTLEISNQYGKAHSFPLDLNVFRPGEIKEKILKVGDQEILTGQMVWRENAASIEHDRKYTITDNKTIYDFENEKWIEVYCDKKEHLDTSRGIMYQECTGWKRVSNNTPVAITAPS